MKQKTRSYPLPAPRPCRRAFVLLALCVPALSAFAQQEPQIAQFMFNKMYFNAGYAGSFPSPQVSGTYRQQWMGLEGAPNTQIISYSQPMLGNRIGVGANLSRSSIGISRAITMDLAYSYRIPVYYGYLGVGLQAGLRHFFQNWADPRLVGAQSIEIDPAIPTEPRSKLLPNFGFGLYYSGDNWYAGVSAPRLVSNNLDFAEFGAVLSREAQHINAMGGADIELDEAVTLTPQLFVRYVKGAPLSVNPNLSAMLYDKLYLGATFSIAAGKGQWAESIQTLVGLQATSEFFLCVSYDIGLTSLRRFHNGSVEATVRWYVNPPEGRDIVPSDRPWEVQGNRRKGKRN
ncbi:MAG: type IX secretion system membrane protein PorP/SprF [Saprospiraceae bacterium]